MESEMRKIKYKNSPVTWINIPCQKVPATFNEFVSAAKKKFNDAEIILLDEDNVVIEEDTFSFFKDITISVESKGNFNASSINSYDWQDIPVISTSHLARPIGEPNLLHDNNAVENSGVGNIETTEPLDRVERNTTECDPFDLRTEIKGVSGGLELIKKYEENHTLDTSDRRLLVNIVVFLMKQKHGKIIPKQEKINYASEVVKLFPNFKDVKSKYGYETFFNPDTGLGFFTNRLKTVNRSKNKKPKINAVVLEESTNEVDEHLQCQYEEDLQATLMFLEFADPKTNIIEIENAMEKTFSFRRKNPQEILKNFPRFLDTPTLINIDFKLIHPNIQRTSFPVNKILQVFGENSNLPEPENKKRRTSTETANLFNDWDDEAKAILTLLRQLPPSTRGRDPKTRGPISCICDKLIVFCKTGNILEDVKLSTFQPCLVAVGPQKNLITNYNVTFEKKFIPLVAKTATEALDQLLKSHYVFDTSYDDDLKNFFKFVEIVFYSLGNDASLTPRMRETKTRLNTEE